MIVKFIPFYILLLLCWSGISFCQEVKRTYQIVNEGTEDDLEMYYHALESKDLDPYRLISESRLIRFDSGIEVELFSAEKLENEYGRMRNHEFMNRMGNELVYPWFWVLSENGEIIDKRITSALD